MSSMVVVTRSTWPQYGRPRLARSGRLFFPITISRSSSCLSTFTSYTIIQRQYQNTKLMGSFSARVYLLSAAALAAALLALFVSSLMIIVLLLLLIPLLAGVRRLLVLHRAVAGGLRAQDDVHPLDVVRAVRLLPVHLRPVEEEDLALLLHTKARARINGISKLKSFFKLHY